MIILIVSIIFSFGFLACLLSSVRILIAAALGTIPIFIIIAFSYDYKLSFISVSWLFSLFGVQFGYFFALLAMMAIKRFRSVTKDPIYESSKSPGEKELSDISRL